MSEFQRDRLIRALQLIVDGVPMKAAAAEIGVSYQTLKNRLMEAYREHKAENVVHLVAIYFREGLLK